MMDRWYWQMCAEEARNMAETFSNLEARRAMLDIADRYDFLAGSADRQFAGDRPERELTPVREGKLLKRTS
jgi:hypothetical protein